MTAVNDHPDHGRSSHGLDDGGNVTVVLDVRGMQFASEKAVVETVLGRVDGVGSVDANPVAQTATVSFDPSRTDVDELSGSVRDCGYHCDGRSLPDHVCDEADRFDTPNADGSDADDPDAQEDHRDHAGAEEGPPSRMT